MALKNCIKTNLILILTVVSAVMGVTIGLLCRQLHLSTDTILLISLPGDTFMRMLKMLILPMVVASMITGIASMDTRSSGKIGLFTIAYYVSTTVIAILVGFALVFIIKPGLHGTLASSDTQSDDFHAPSTVDMIHDLIKNLFPDNIVSAAIQSTYTLYVKEEFIDVKKESPEKSMHQNVTNTFYRESNSTPLVEPDGGNTTDQSMSIWTAKTVNKPGLNVLGIHSYGFIFHHCPVESDLPDGILVYCAVFGAMLGKLGHKGRVVFKFFEELNDITMGMVRIVMWFSPLGILSLITGKILSVSDLAGMVYRLWMFIATCITGLFVQSVVIIPLIYLILTRKNPFRVSLGIVHALLTALGTDSSAVTLPVTIECCEKNLKIGRTISRFVLPIGATINMDGAAIFQVVTPVYIAQLSGVHLSILDILALGIGRGVGKSHRFTNHSSNHAHLVSIFLIALVIPPSAVHLSGLSATLASIGAAAVPGSVIAITMTFLISMGLPTNELYIILAMDWFLGRLRTVTNVNGDCMAAALLQHFFNQDGNNGPTSENNPLPEDEGQLEAIQSFV